jgi:uncharacterized protein YndB with AHSA1/START domain
MTLTQNETVTHRTFSIERTYPVSPARVFAAFADPVVKRRWFVDGEGWDIDEYTSDFRIGGHEISRFRFEGGPPISNDTLYLDIVPEQRLIFSYTMALSGAIFSASLATITFAATDAGTRMVYTEQGTFIGDPEQAVGRETGCQELLDKLGAELAA